MICKGKMLLLIFREIQKVSNFEVLMAEQQSKQFPRT